MKLREALDVNRVLAKHFSELESRVGQHDQGLVAIIEAIRQLIAPEKQSRREMGFHLRETAPRRRR